MYGMVNQAIRSMVIEKLGKQVWVDICKDANLDPIGFNSFEQYDDEVTLNLVGLICNKSQLPPPVLLEDFGKYWIDYARKSEYQAILKNFATSPVELIESLDALHSRLQLAFDNLKAPAFWVTRTGDKEVLVHYKSERDMPLKYFVLGLLKGIFAMFDQECRVDFVEPKSGETAVFQVNY